jgi:D-alanyl-D-alanine carboxypeptidase (penicillin-binding protein 5/6)
MMKNGSRRNQFGMLILAGACGLTACSGPVPSGGTRTEAGRDAGIGGGAAVAEPVSRTRDLGTPPAVRAAAYVVVDPRSGEVLLEHNGHQRRPVASTQKLLAALVLLDQGRLEEWVTVAATDTRVEPTKMGIAPGERYRRRDLLQAMVVRSSNDIAACLARTAAGSEAAFVARMNAKAASLGMRNSRFASVHGLDAPGQYSTAFDLAILATAALDHPELHRMTQIREMVFPMADGTGAHLVNTNRVLRMSPYCNGLKTGYTSSAGRCLVSSGQRGLRKAVVVVLGSQLPDVWEDSRELLHWALGVNAEVVAAGP